MDELKFHRASNAFYDAVEATLHSIGISIQLTGDEMKIVDEFAGLDFGAEPCARYIKDIRQKEK